jgi:uncharacterized protein with GYD domain
MLFIALISPKGRGIDIVKDLKRVKNEDVEIIETYFTFGRYDGIILFEADTEISAMKFIVSTELAKTYNIETLIAVPAKSL